MPLESILYVAFVVAALTQFAAVLAYAEWATRHASDDTPRRARHKREAASHRDETVAIRKAA